MTEKELLYMEDAVSHEEIMINYLEETIDLLDDNSLVNFFNKEIDKHKKTKEKLMNTLKEKNND